LARGFELQVEGDWLTASPLTAASLNDEVRQWSGLGLELKIKSYQQAPAL
jgi:exopolyphosphatase/guanosine-5'-triphosphate,3'-diphosphate pyrophosphatase